MIASRHIRIHINCVPTLPQVCGNMYDFIQNILSYHPKKWIEPFQWGEIVNPSSKKKVSGAYAPVVLMPQLIG